MEVTQSIQKTIQVLVQAGFVVNLKKSELAPTQDLVYTGARFHMDLGRLYLPDILVQALTVSPQNGHTNHTPISEATGVNGCYVAFGVICPPPHVPHPVIPEAALNPYNLRVCIILSLSARI